MTEGKLFNVRVYALLINSCHELLIAEEYHFDTFIRKLPGGGLQFGEGTIECIQRELYEELGIVVTNIRHFFTTDFFIQSAFNPEHQFLGIYYLAEIPQACEEMFRETVKIPHQNGQETFKWVHMSAINAEDFTFPADKVVIRKLLATIPGNFPLS